MKTLHYLFARFFTLFLLVSAIPSTVFSQELPETFVHTLSSDDESFTINFSRFSSRGPLFEVALQQSDGSFQVVDAGEPRTILARWMGNLEQ